MRSLMQKTQKIIIRYAQVLVVVLAFALMVISSYLFVGDTERKHLRRYAEEAISYTEANIKSDMQELETLLGVVSQTIGDMLVNGVSSDIVNNYILLINNYVEAGSEKRLYGAAGIFGVFDVFGGAMLIGHESWIPPDDYYQTARPWYTGAVLASGEISITEPYVNEYSKQKTITLSRRIFDHNRRALGIICLNIELDRIEHLVVSTQFVEGGYGFLLSENMMIISHPDPEKVGMSFSDVKSEIPAYKDELMEKGKISEVVARDYRGIRTIVFMERLQNGWYMGTVTPIDSYFRSTRNLAVILAVLGAIFAALLVWMLLRIFSEKAMADERMKIMFDATPLVAYIFNKDYNVIDCNQTAVTLFDLSSKQEFCGRFYELMPEYQLDGRLTADIGMEVTRKTLEEGSSRFEWTYRKLNGEPMPCEITCTRVMYKNDLTIVGYMRDLREQKKMQKLIEQRTHLLDTVNSAAAVLLASSNVESFEVSLLKSFEFVGRCLDVDRVQIWCNEIIDGDLHFVLRYEWLSNYGRTCQPVPMGIHFPYSMKKNWEEMFLRGECINSPVCQLPEEDKALLCNYGMKSIVLLPMFLDGDFWGFFSIDDCRRERTFSDDEISILSSAGLMMTSAVNRNTQAIKMREAEERTQIMIDAAPLCAIFWDKDLKMLDCNQEVVKMFGVANKQEFINRFTIFSPDYQSDGMLSVEKGPGLVRKALDEGYSRFEWMHQNLNGELIPAEVTCIRVKYRDEYTVTEYIRDLREQKAMMAADEKIREADERIRSIFDTTPLAITIWDPESITLIDCNMEAVRVVGLADKKTYIEKFAEMSPEYQPNGQKTSEMVVQIFDKVIRDGVYRYNWDQMSVNGEAIPFQVSTVRIKHMDGYIIISYAQDMRETNTAIAKMRETDEFTQVMFKAMPLSCQLWNTELQCLMCNDEAIRVYRVADKKYFLDNFFDFSPEYQPDGRPSKEKGHEYLRKGFEDGYFRFEWIHKRGDGEEFPCEITMIRAMFNGEAALLTYTRDLSEEMAVLKERHKAEIAEESSKAKSDFLARMSHEIRTPMNAILGITEIQLQDESLPRVIKEALEKIYSSGDLLLGIINDILDLSKIEAGKLELIPAQYDIASLIHDTVQLNIMRYESKPIDFKLNMDENLPVMLLGDELRIKQILNNLLSNAFKYTNKGSVNLSISFEPDGDKESSGLMLIFRVSDTGQGMTAEQVHKLGNEYARFNMEANRKTEGAGLGMNITMSLVHIMNGSISIDSTPGVGSMFTVRLPQGCVESEPIGKELAENLMQLNLSNVSKIRTVQMNREFMPYGRVLVVDDVETNLYVARGLMAPYGLSIDIAMSGYEAIEKIKDGASYDVVFMDHMMPGMDGIEAAKIIRSMGYTQPVVALTANALAGQAEIFLNNGFDDFISKPIDIRQLNAVLNKLIRDKQPPEALEAARLQRDKLYTTMQTSVDPQLAEFFIHDAKKAAAILETIYINKRLESDDVSMFIINVHAMKSALANIGEASLSADAAKLEQAGRDQNVKFILSELPSFLELLHGVIHKLEAKEAGHEKAEPEADDIPYLKEKMLAIQAACTAYNKKAAKEALAELKQKTWTAAIKEHLSTIAEYLLHSEFDEAAKAIDDYIQPL